MSARICSVLRLARGSLWLSRRVVSSTQLHSIQRSYTAAAQRKVDDIHESEPAQPFAPRNPVGVQLLSRPLHAQVFPDIAGHGGPQTHRPPALHPEALSLSLAHLRTHGLDPSQAAVLNPTAFTLPQLQGANLSEHFWQIGREAAQPWLSLAEEFASMQQEGSTFSQSSNHTLLAAPSTGDQGADEESGDDFGYLPAEEWLALDSSAQSLLRPQQPHWKWQAGWTMYPFLSGKPPAGDATASRALGEGIKVDHPPLDDYALVFDVETLVNSGPWPVMATALGSKGWYAWLSPWLTGDSDSNEHLIPFGSSTSERGAPSPPRLLVGHNVGYDRGRVLDEYSIERPSIRYLDTMSLHVAIRGISSPQRPAYMKKRKERQQAAEALAAEELELKLMAKEEVKRILADTLGIEPLRVDGEDAEDRTVMNLLEDDDTDRVAAEVHALFELGDDSSASDPGSRAEAAAVVQSIVRGLQAKRAEVAAAAEAEVQAEAEANNSLDTASTATNDSLRATTGADGTVEWHEVTSRNSLLEVAALHCGIRLDKDIRETFVDDDTTVDTLRNDWVNLLNYCAADTAATHSVLQAVLPAFRQQCPHPATFAGVLGMGSMILPVQSDQWQTYKETSEAIWKKMSDEVETALMQRAEQVMRTGVARRSQISGDPDVSYLEDDPWLQQLDWTPKKPKLRRLKTGSDSEAASVGDVDPLALDSATQVTVPKWYRDAASRTKSKAGLTLRSTLAPSLLQLRYRKRFSVFKDGEWVAVRYNKKQEEVERISLGSASPFAKSFEHGDDLSSTSIHGQAALEALSEGRDEAAKEALEKAAWEMVDLFRHREPQSKKSPLLADPKLSWDWVSVDRSRLPYAPPYEASLQEPTASAIDGPKKEPSWWPKWYWDTIKMPKVTASEASAALSSTEQDSGHHPFMDLSIRSKIAPLLLELSWKGFPLFHSREHGWTYRQPATSAENENSEDGASSGRRKPLTFKLEADKELLSQAEKGGVIFQKLPHASGEDANVGSPFSKSFLPFFENKTLQAGLTVKGAQGSAVAQRVPGSDAAQKAMALNTECAYWVSARDRIMNQMVVKHGQAGTVISRDDETGKAHENLALILPQVITMGTITRRAIERTWLTASNAKKNRVGSELKSMVKAPPGWSIVGADVDSEELWICSVMGDAQFGMHGATAVGWMTLEGTKALGTDLHSKTASILGTSRNQAKVFNYSRIYGAGIKHATQLMLKANPKLSSAEAAERAKALYRATKGLSTHRQEYFGRKFWHGGTESYVFNKLESIALSDNPQTPALDCGITAALSREYLPKATARDKAKFGEDYMPSRINWVVQSSGVDYLHLLISSMEHICKKYDIAARFMLSVHDEVRYLCREEDRYRTALALQISNLWTRSMFAYKLEMDDLPQSCAFFAQVDIDHVLRKEVDDPCITPSHPTPIPNGEALDIEGILSRTHSGSLHLDGRPMQWEAPVPIGEMPDLYPPYQPTHQSHRSIGSQGQYYLEAQATSDINEIRALDKRAKLEERMAREGDRDDVKQVKERKRAAPVRRARKTQPPKTPADDVVAATPSAPTQGAAEEAWLDQCASTAVSEKRPRIRRFAAKATKTLATSSVRPTTVSANVPPTAQFSTSASACTSAGDQNRASILRDIEDISALIPARQSIRGLGRPFFKFREHRMKILWGLYRPILRLVPDECPTLFAYLRARFHRKKGLVTLIQTTMVMQQAQWWLDLLVRFHSGDEEALEDVQRQERRLAKQAKRQAVRENERQIYHKSVNPPPIPHIMGSIMHPTREFPAMPRYKPVQPIQITMMILRRKRQRVRVLDQLKDTVHYRDSIAFERRAERDFQAAEEDSFDSSSPSSSSFFSDPAWDEPVAMEFSRIRAIDYRSKERERSPVPLKLLQQSKAALRARQRNAAMLKVRAAKSQAEKMEMEKVRKAREESEPDSPWAVEDRLERERPLPPQGKTMREQWFK
ncbi:hypothetical protein V8E36_001377 [Tilletia maclaganii]